MTTSRSFTRMIEHGPVVAIDREMGLVVTASNDGLALWFHNHAWGWGMCDSRPSTDLYTLQIGQVMALASEWLREIRAGYEADREAGD